VIVIITIATLKGGGGKQVNMNYY